MVAARGSEVEAQQQRRQEPIEAAPPRPSLSSLLSPAPPPTVAGITTPDYARSAAAVTLGTSPTTPARDTTTTTTITPAAAGGNATGSPAPGAAVVASPPSDELRARRAFLGMDQDGFEDVPLDGGGARIYGQVARTDTVSRAFPSCPRSILAEMYLWHACSCHEIEDGNSRTGWCALSLTKYYCPRGLTPLATRPPARWPACCACDRGRFAVRQRTLHHVAVAVVAVGVAVALQKLEREWAKRKAERDAQATAELLRREKYNQEAFAEQAAAQVWPHAR
jgi:hypothetical protein